MSFVIATSDDHERALTDALAIVGRLIENFRVDRSPRPSHPTVESAPRLRIGVGQLRASASSYLDRAAAGDRIAIVRRGTVVAEFAPPSES
jgi:hypothetical protein